MQNSAVIDSSSDGQTGWCCACSTGGAVNSRIDALDVNEVEDAKAFLHEVGDETIFAEIRPSSPSATDHEHQAESAAGFHEEGAEDSKGKLPAGASNDEAPLAECDDGHLDADPAAQKAPSPPAEEDAAPAAAPEQVYTRAYAVSRKPSTFSIADYKDELKIGIAAQLPKELRKGGKQGGCCCRTGLMEYFIASTPQEELAHRQLSQLASIQLDEKNEQHQLAMAQYWELMIGSDVPYEARSPRWSDDLGFQSSNPWTDFRGGGLLALRCLLFLADKHNAQAKILAEEAKFANSHAWYPFSAAGISICQMLAVHVRLHARPIVGPVRTRAGAHVLALKRFLHDLDRGDPVEVFASYWLAALLKLHKEWRDLCQRDPRANVSVSFNKVYKYVGIAVESALATTQSDRLKVLAEVNTRAKRTVIRNSMTRTKSRLLVGLVRLERFCRCFSSRSRRPDAQQSEDEDEAEDLDLLYESQSRRARDRAITEGSVALAPPELIKANQIYELYRGATGIVDSIGKCRVWVDFPRLQLALAGEDMPAASSNSVSLLDITWCQYETVADDDTKTLRVNVYSNAGSGRLESPKKLKSPRTSQRPSISVTGPSEALREFGANLETLLQSRDEEGNGALLFIQKRLSQYLWRSVQLSLSADRLIEAQAVLTFNLNPKEGIAYVKKKLRKETDEEIGEWLSQVSTEKGGLDPTMLGEYFSRKDTLQVFWNFVSRVDFGDKQIVCALRQLFDTFKPGGEGQVITRILEYFARSYYLQWQKHQASMQPPTSYQNEDTVLQVAVSLIMLNTGLHVAPKKCGKKVAGAAMTVEEYITNTRRLVTEEEVPEAALRFWYEDISVTEISVEPMPRVPFSKLPVHPNIEGWLVAVFDAETQFRYWAVLVLQRIYLFADSEVDPVDVIDLKDVVVEAVAEDPGAGDRYLKDLTGRSRSACCGGRQRPRAAEKWLLEADRRALEISQRSTDKPSLLQKLCKKPRSRLVFVAESRDLMEKWVNLISCGP